ncbi:MAG: YIP1 family protein [archaeon]|nr:YIP1 family protein [archaeon]
MEYNNILVSNESEHKKPPMIIPSYSDSVISNPMDNSSAAINVSSSNTLDKLNKENKIETPEEIQPKSISSEQYIKNRPYETEVKDTLHEPVLQTIIRDLKLIWNKMKYVLNPFIKGEEKAREIRQWDLWGPLIFTLMLSITLMVNRGLSERQFTLVFAIFWVGGFLVYLNGNLLGAHASLFQILCLLGYSIFPLNILAILIGVDGVFEIIRGILAILACAWSCIAVSGFLGGTISEDKKYMVLYPAVLVYLFLTGIIYMS